MKGMIFSLLLFNSVMVGSFVFFLIQRLFGDKPLVRLVKLLAGLLVGIIYFLVGINWWFNEWAIVGWVEVLLFTFTPIGVLGITWLIRYMYKK